MALFFLIALIAWLIAGYFWEGRERNKEKILAEMREIYSKREAYNLLYEMKNQAMLIGLLYGTVIGVCIVVVFRR